MGQRSISIAELRAEAINLRRAVASAKLAGESEMDPHVPGNEKNEKKDARGWLRYLNVLHRLHARGEMRQTSDARQRADAAVLQALRDEPVRVELITPIEIEPGVMTSALFVYQKSLDALLQAHALDREIAWLLLQGERVQDAGARGMPRSSELYHKVTSAISYAYQLLAWIMTHPGPGMPYEPTIKGDPVPPAYITALNPMDYPQIAAAAQQHHARLAAVQALLEHKSTAEGGHRPTWSQFYGSLAIEMDENAVQLTRFHSLGSLLAAVQLDADAKTPDDKGATERPESSLDNLS